MLVGMSDNVTSVVAILPASDLAASLAWWVEKCGFTEQFRHGEPPTYAGFSRGGAMLHLTHVEGDELARTVAGQTVVRLIVEDVDAMLAEYLERGGKVHPNGGLAVRPWGTKEFATIDPVGVLVWFTQPLGA